MNLVLCPENEIRKTQVSKEVVVGVFSDVEKAYDMLCKEGILMKLDRMGLKWKMYNSMLNFLFWRTIQLSAIHIFSDISDREWYSRK